jgi:hypothetical protein
VRDGMMISYGDILERQQPTEPSNSYADATDQSLNRPICSISLNMITEYLQHSIPKQSSRSDKDIIVGGYVVIIKVLSAHRSVHIHCQPRGIYTTS